MTTILSPDSQHKLGQYAQVVRGKSGIFAVTRFGDEYQIGLFGKSATYLRTIGGHGSEAGKFASPVAFHVMSAGDTLLVVDYDQQVHLFGPTGDFIRRTQLPIQPYALLKLSNGNYILQAGVGSSESVGLPLHIVDSTGNLLKSFGSIDGRFVPLETAAITRALSVAPDGNIVMTAPNRFRIELWRPNGEFVRVVEPKTDWFQSYLQLNGDVRVKKPNPTLGKASIVGSTIFLAVGIPAPDWKAVAPSEAELPPITARIKSKLLSVRIVAVNVTTGRVVASQDVHGASFGPMDNEFFYRRIDGAAGATRLDVFRALLTPAERSYHD